MNNVTDPVAPGPAFRMPGVVYPPADQIARYVAAGYLGKQSLIEGFMAAHAQYADRPALVGPEGNVSHGELDDITNRIASAFMDMGLQPLDRVMFQLPNCNELMFGLLGCLKAGLIPVCTLVSHREREIGYLAKHAAAKLHLVQGDDAKFDHVAFAETMQTLAPSLRHIVVARSDARGKALSLKALYEAQDPALAKHRVNAVVRDPFQVVLFQLSGGTTGVPKIIPRFGAEYLYNMRAGAAWFGFREDDIYFNPMPIMHNFNLVCCTGPVLLSGGAIALSPSLTPESLVGILREQKPTWLTLGGPLLAKITPAIASGAVNFAQVRGSIATSGAAKISALTGAPAYHVFGMTEGMIIYTHPSDPLVAQHETVGRPISPLDRVRILKPGTEEELPLGEVGEPAFNGPYTIHGYYDAAERNAETFTSDGAYRSGDLMSVRRIDGKDYFVFQGRIKDVVDRAGEKINAEEVEWAVATHPAIAGCGVIGVKDKVYGERVCACIVVRPGSAAPDVVALGQHLEAYGLAKFKWPERIEVMADLPVTHVGKLDKIALRQRYQNQEVKS